ncbi:hypothetical protein ABIA94_005399 [Bradyrhizobium sp. LA7.1]
MTLPLIFADPCFLLLYGPQFVAMNVAPTAVPNRCAPKSFATEALARVVDGAYMRWILQLGPRGSETCRLKG